MSDAVRPGLFPETAAQRKQRVRKNIIRGAVFSALVLIALFFPYNHTITGIATLSPKEYTVIQSATKGIIKDVYVDLGSHVEPGELLLEIDNSDLKLEAENYLAETEIIKEEIGQLERKLQYLQKLKETKISLHQQNQASDLEVEEAGGEVFDTQSQLDIKRKQLETMGRKYQLALTGLQRTRIQSKIAGTIVGIIDLKTEFVGSLKNKIGSYVEEGEILCRVANTETPTLEFPIDEKYLRFLEEGRPVAVRFYAYPDTVYAGVVRGTRLFFWEKKLFGRADQNVINVYMEVEKGQFEFKPGMKAKVEIDIGRTCLARTLLDAFYYLLALW
jgi:multidrug resistance efflux pump